MNQRLLSRRAFLSATGQAASKSCIALSLPMILTACDKATRAKLANENFVSLSPEEAQEFSAIAARIIPTDDTPGATEAGVIYFIDTVIADGRNEEFTILQAGLNDLQVTTVQKHNVDFFYLLDSEQQGRLLTDIEDSEFFNTIRFLTIAGMFSMPGYGGNRNHIGDRLLGYEDRHAWLPPFGFYDADYAEKGE